MHSSNAYATFLSTTKPNANCGVLDNCSVSGEPPLNGTIETKGEPRQLIIVDLGYVSEINIGNRLKIFSRETIAQEE